MAYVDIDEQTLSLIKWPPIFEPEVAYGDDTNYPYNNLRGSVSQFSYRYIMDDYEKTVFSPISKVPIPQGEELLNGDYVDDPTLNNYIAVKLDLGHHTVTKLEVAVRLGNDRDGFICDIINKFSGLKLTGRINPNGTITSVGGYGGNNIVDFKEGMIIKLGGNRVDPTKDLYIKRIDLKNKIIYYNEEAYTASTSAVMAPQDISEQYIYSIFRNDGSRIALDQSDYLLAFHDVPITSEALRIMQNRLWLGNNLKGEENVDVNIDIEQLSNHRDNLETTNYFENAYNRKYTWPDGGGTFPAGYSFSNIFIYLKDSDLIVGDLLSFVIYWNDSKSTKFSKKITSTDTAASILQLIADVVNNDPYMDYDYDANRAYFTGSETGKIPETVWPAHEVSFHYVTADYHPPVYATFTGKTRIITYNGYEYIPAKSNESIPTDYSPSGSPISNEYWTYIAPHSDLAQILTISTLSKAGVEEHKLIDSFSLNIFEGNSKYKSLKAATTKQYAIEYLDKESRKGGANTKNNIKILTDYPVYTATQIYNKLSIKNQPPNWAYYWRLLVNYSTPSFYQFYCNSYAHTTPDIFTVGSTQCVNVNNNIITLRDKLPKITMSNYSFNKGDRFVILAVKGDISDDNLWSNIPSKIDKEIIGEDTLTGDYYKKDDNDVYILDSNGNKIKTAESGFIIIEPLTTAEIDLIKDAKYFKYEIYTPVKDQIDSKRFYQFGRTFEIGNPTANNRYHKADDQDQDPDNLITTPAIINLDNEGDVYLRNMFTGVDGLFLTVESSSISDFYESNSIDQGIFNIETPDLGQVLEYEAYQFSNQYFADSKVNGLSAFISTNKEKLHKGDGAIIELLNFDYILKVIQATKITSIYINRTVSYRPDGTEEYLLTDKIIGFVKPFEDNYGSEFKGSIEKHETHFYFFDGRKAKWVRSAYNGNQPISDYKFNSEITDIASSIRQNSYSEVISIFDVKHGTLICTHYYKEDIGSYNTIYGVATDGSREVTAVGVGGGTSINDIEVGWVFDLNDGTVSADNDTFVVLIDTDNKKLYLNKPLIGSGSFTAASAYNKMVFKTYTFFERANRWKEKMDFFPELYGIVDDEVLSFSGGELWRHEATDVYGNFYGIQFPFEVKFVSNLDPQKIKIYKAIALYSNKAIGSLSKGDIEILSLDKRGVNMQSKLPTQRFINLEGHYDASLLKDMNDPRFNSELQALRNGRELRGQAAIIKLTDKTSDEIILFSVILYVEPSEPSK